MFELYTEPARRVIFLGRHEALVRGADAITPEHLLLGLLREETDRPSALWALGAVAASEAYAGLALRLPSPTAEAAVREIPLTLESRRVLLETYSHGRRLKQGHIGVGHLLLGLLTYDTRWWHWPRRTTFVAAYLREVGFDVRKLKRHVRTSPHPKGESGTSDTNQ